MTRAGVATALLMTTSLGFGCGSSTDAAGSVACSDSNATASSSVTLTDDSFNPSCITVPVGTKVTWTNTGNPIHTVTTESGAPEGFDSGQLGANGTFSFTFTKAGVVPYVCTPHVSAGMRGTVIVK